MLISAAKSGTKKAGWIISEHGISAQPSGGRQRRVVLPGGPHHITQRGNNRRDVFFEDSDRELYLCLLREYAAKYQVEILGYCLMTNHVHLIAIPADATGLAKTIGRVHNDYARWLHIRRRESGHLWQNRFLSRPLEPGGISAGRIAAIGWRYRSGRKVGRRRSGGLRSRKVSSRRTSAPDCTRQPERADP